MKNLKLSEPVKCPCCNQFVEAPPPDIIEDLCNLPPMQRRIFRAIYRGRGFPVQASRVFDAMYYDDPDGGPEPTKMYNAFKVGLCGLRKRLKECNAGVTIENVGYRMGYRLIILQGKPA